VNAALPRTLEPIPLVPPNPERRDGGWLAGWERRDFLELGAHDTAPATARGVLRERLPLWGLRHLVEPAELVATELITNSCHATRQYVQGPRLPPVRVWLLGTDAAVAVLVWDDVPHPPVPGEAELMDESGRGLSIVAALSAGWGFWFPAAPFTGKVTMAVIGS
jgi:hypothetical protein